MRSVEIREAISKPRCQRLSADGSRKAALVDVASGGATAHIASQVLVADASAADFDPEAQLAIFDARAERIEWSGADLLVAFPAGAGAGVFLLFPGPTLRAAPGSDGVSGAPLRPRPAPRAAPPPPPPGWRDLLR